MAYNVSIVALLREYFNRELPFVELPSTREFNPHLTQEKENCAVTCSLEIIDRQASTELRVVNFDSETGTGAVSYDPYLGPFDGDSF